MKQPKDKRTKEYKEWLKTQKTVEIEDNIGVGDVVETITEALGIKKCEPCEERKRKWNKISLFRKHKVARCLTDEQLTQYKEYKDTTKVNTWKPEDVKLLTNLYAHAFAIQYNTRNMCTSCKGSADTMKHIETQLDKLIDKQGENN